jgi:hypothetical protein
VNESPMTALDRKIKERAALRRPQTISDKEQSERTRLAKLGDRNARDVAMENFLKAFEAWQSMGYSFGEDQEQVEFHSTKEMCFEGRADLKWDDAKHKVLQYIQFRVLESANPLDSLGRNRSVEWVNEEPTGVLIQGSINDWVKGQVLVQEWEYRPRVAFKAFFEMDRLDSIKEALVPMLSELVDAINPIAAELTL